MKKISQRTIKKFSQYASVVISFLAVILYDILRMGGTLEFITDKKYWMLIILNLVLIVIIMITLRSIHKSNLIAQSNKIQSNLAFVDRARRVIIGNAYSKKLNQYLDEVNAENKYQAYLRKVNKKLYFIDRLWLLKEEKRDTLKKKYETMLEVPKSEVIKQYIRYRKVTITGLFADVDGKIITEDEYDISPHDMRDVAQMVGVKAMLVMLFAAFTGTMTIQIMWQGWDALLSIVFKLISIMLACNCAIKQAEDFVNYNINQALNNRVDILSNFVNNDMLLKNKMIQLKFIEEKVKDDSLIENEEIKPTDSNVNKSNPT